MKSAWFLLHTSGCPAPPPPPPQHPPLQTHTPLHPPLMPCCRPTLALHSSCSHPYCAPLPCRCCTFTHMQVFWYDGACEQLQLQQPSAPLMVDSRMQARLPRRASPWLKPSPRSVAVPRERFRQAFFQANRSGVCCCSAPLRRPMQQPHDVLCPAAPI